MLDDFTRVFKEGMIHEKDLHDRTLLSLFVCFFPILPFQILPFVFTSSSFFFFFFFYFFPGYTWWSPQHCITRARPTSRTGSLYRAVQPSTRGSCNTIACVLLCCRLVVIVKSLLLSQTLSYNIIVVILLQFYQKQLLTQDFATSIISSYRYRLANKFPDKKKLTGTFGDIFLC